MSPHKYILIFSILRRKITPLLSAFPPLPYLPSSAFLVGCSLCHRNEAQSDVNDLLLNMVPEHSCSSLCHLQMSLSSPRALSSIYMWVTLKRMSPSPDMSPSLLSQMHTSTSTSTPVSMDSTLPSGSYLIENSILPWVT